jgi:type I restriction enzyme S subunit
VNANLQVDWPKKRLKFVAPLRNERADATSEHTDYLGLENIQSWTGKILPSTAADFSDDDEATSGTANVFYEGDVLFGKLRPYLAKAVSANKNGVCSTELLVLKPQLDIHPRFLLYSILSPDFVGQVDASTFGAKMPRANWEFIGSMKLPIPIFEPQRFVADYLDRETTRIDALVAEKERMLVLLEEKRAALIGYTVTRGLNPDVLLKPSGFDWLGEIPAHWETKKLKHVASLNSGETITADSISDVGDFPVYGGNGFRGFTTEYTHIGDYVLIGRQGALCGNINYASGKFWASEHAVVVSMKSRDDVFWLGELLRFMNLNQYSQSAAQPGISVEVVENLKIPVPPISEQIEIANYMKKEAKYINQIRNEIAKTIALLKERRSALITAAVTGQIPLEAMTV